MHSEDKIKTQTNPRYLAMGHNLFVPGVLALCQSKARENTENRMIRTLRLHESHLVVNKYRNLL